ncbi:hypothetical protein US8_03937 [Bacillus altitudinis]|nr:hypothetical protein US8_03937 [Bacillus altitudinis]
MYIFTFSYISQFKAFFKISQYFLVSSSIILFSFYFLVKKVYPVN